MWRILVFKVFEAHTVCKKQEQKYCTVVKIWLEIPYGVCVCVLVDKEPVRGFRVVIWPRSWQVHHEKAGKRTYRTVHSRSVDREK